jgi:nitroreductase
LTVDEAIRARRTHKQFGSEPVPRETLEELLDLARFAPNHKLTQPWRFRVVGPETLARLKEAGGPKEAPKLERAPTIVCVSAKLSGDPLTDDEDVLATGAALYIVMLAAHARGLASYWRTPDVMRTPAGREIVGLGDDERFVGLIYLGPRCSEPPGKERDPLESRLAFLPSPVVSQ